MEGGGGRGGGVGVGGAYVVRLKHLGDGCILSSSFFKQARSDGRLQQAVDELEMNSRNGSGRHKQRRSAANHGRVQLHHPIRRNEKNKKDFEWTRGNVFSRNQPAGGRPQRWGYLSCLQQTEVRFYANWLRQSHYFVALAACLWVAGRVAPRQHGDYMSPIKLQEKSWGEKQWSHPSLLPPVVLSPHIA